MVLILNNIMKRTGSLSIYKVVAVMVCSLYAEGADVRPLETKSDAASIRSLESPEVRLANASLEPQRLDGANGKRIPGTLKGRDGLYAVPIMQREGMPYPILGVGIANDGTVYVTKTVRQMREEISLIQNGSLLEHCMKFRTTAEKRRWIEKNFNAHIAGRQGVQDFNNDGKVDAADLSIHSEEIYIVRDSDNDGVFDKSTLFASEFNDLLTGVAHSVTPIDGHVYATIIPDMWKLTDTDGDGVADQRESLAHGFAPHIGYGNHDLHSVVQGYDGKIYWSMGDRGINVRTKDGRLVSNPDSGCIVRSNPDGSEFEVFAYGLRNCQYFDFDEYGNIFSVDHDADFQGERERLVFLPEGSDSGWRMYYQYRNSTNLVRAAREDLYNPWLAEKMWVPFHAGQPSHILPPIENSWNAPASFSYHPGVALAGKYAGHFFLGGKGIIRAFKMVPDGATFKREGDDEVITGLGPQVLTSAFAPDGRMYFTLWKALAEQSALWALDAGVTSQMTTVQKLLATGLAMRPSDHLEELLAHADRRVRLAAQFELVSRKDLKTLTALAMNAKAQRLARIHAIWGLGQLKHKDKALLSTLCDDKDEEVRAQTARWAGELRFDPESCIPSLLGDAYPRVRLMAAIAAGKLKNPTAVEPLKMMLIQADNTVPVIRHAGVMGLTGSATSEELGALANHESEALRIAAVLALRRQGAVQQLTKFLSDPSPQVLSDATCAIYDDATPQTLTDHPTALAAVAASLNAKNPAPVNVRALAANRRLGTVNAAKRISDFLATDKLDPTLQVEALYSLESWTETQALDLVDGRHFPVAAGDSTALRAAVGPRIWHLADSSNARVSKVAIKLLRLIEPSEAELMRAQGIILDTDQRSESRIEWLGWLGAQAPNLLVSTATRLLADDSATMRMAAARQLKQAKKAESAVADYLLSTLSRSTDARELQQAIEMVPGLQTKGAVVDRLLNDLTVGKVRPEVQLEVMEIAGKEPALQERFEAYQSKLKARGVMAEYSAALDGGSIKAGERLFRTHAQAQCSKCHAIKLTDKQIGPSLEGIGKRETGKYLLQSIVDPQASIAPGYGVVSVELTNGEMVSGMLMKDGKTAVTIKLPDSSVKTMNRAEIKTMSNPVGMMPDLKSVLTPREIRDLVAYLKTL